MDIKFSVNDDPPPSEFDMGDISLTQDDITLSSLNR